MVISWSLYTTPYSINTETIRFWVPSDFFIKPFLSIVSLIKCCGLMGTSNCLVELIILVEFHIKQRLYIMVFFCLIMFLLLFNYCIHVIEIVKSTIICISTVSLVFLYIVLLTWSNWGWVGNNSLMFWILCMLIVCKQDSLSLRQTQTFWFLRFLWGEENCKWMFMMLCLFFLFNFYFNCYYYGIQKCVC